MRLRQLIASSCRQKILETLSTLRETHLMDLVRRVNSTYAQVNRNLQILEKEGIIKIRLCGRLKMIRLDRESPKTEAILKALGILRNVEMRSFASQKAEHEGGKRVA